MEYLSRIWILKSQIGISRNITIIVMLIMISCSSQKKLLKNETPENLTSFKKFVYSRNADSVIKINKKNLRYIYRNTKTGEDVFFRFMDNYSSYLTRKIPVSKELSFEENAYVSGHLVEYLYKCQMKIKENDLFKNIKFVNCFLAPRHANKYNKEFKKHDYYGLKLLKKHHLEHFWEYPEQDTIPSIKRIIE